MERDSKMRQCNKCFKVKPLEDFYKDSAVKCGRRPDCKECKRAYDKQNGVKYRNRLGSLLSERKRQEKRRNRAAYNARNKNRKCRAKKAMPTWLTSQQKDWIKSWYTMAKAMERDLGGKWHVDHIVPLQGDIVCGLHVPWNLQVLPAAENIKKGNKL